MITWEWMLPQGIKLRVCCSVSRYRFKLHTGLSAAERTVRTLKPDRECVSDIATIREERHVLVGMIHPHASKVCLLDVSARHIANKSYKEGSCDATTLTTHIKRGLTRPLRQLSIRCPCGSKEALPHAQKLQEGQQDWVACDICNVWQHSICVGLLEDLEKNMPEKYFCEECKPELHKRFHFGAGSDNRYAVASERREMHAIPHTRDEIHRKAKWLVTEINAIAESHPQAVTVEWAKLNGMHADFQAERKASPLWSDSEPG